MLEFRSPLGRLGVRLVVLVFAAFYLYPLYSMVRISSSGQGLVTNYKAVFAQDMLVTFFRNSAIIAAGAVVISYTVTMLAAFALAKLPVRGRELYFYGILLALTFPSVALTVPLFVTVQRAGLFNTYWAVIIPLAALPLPFNVLVARGFITALPDELFDAARIDGCGTVRTFLQLVLPLAKPISGVVVVTTFLAAWNEYILPLLFLQDTDKQPVTLLPSYFQSAYNSDVTKITAASVVIALPTVVVYLAAQRLFERGFTGGALK